MKIQHIKVYLEDQDVEFKLMLSIDKEEGEFEYEVSHRYQASPDQWWKGSLTAEEKFHFEDVITIQKVLQKYINNILGD